MVWFRLVWVLGTHLAEKGYLLSGQDFLWPGLGIHPDESLPTGFLSRDTAEQPFHWPRYGSDFVGRSRVLSSLDSDVKWHGLRCLDRGPAPRLGHAVKSSDDDKSEIIGYVTSGCPSPSLSRTGIAMAYLNNTEIGAEFGFNQSRRRVRAKVVRPPFV